MKATADALRAYVEGVLRPMVQVDGGDVVFEGLEGPVMTLRFRGDCSKCGATACHLVPWIADKIEKRFGERYEIAAVMDRPYFYR